MNPNTLDYNTARSIWLGQSPAGPYAARLAQLKRDYRQLRKQISGLYSGHTAIKTIQVLYNDLEQAYINEVMSWGRAA